MKICKSEKEYIQAVAPAVQRACKRYGYLPSVLIAQSCLENGFAMPSAWDNPGIADLLKHNNMVGQKRELLTDSWYDYSVWSGEYFTKKTPEWRNGHLVPIEDDFRIFDSVEQSFCDYLLFLTYASNGGYHDTPKYGPEVVNIKDPASLIKAVRERGYATDPSYDKSVMKIVKRHNLTKYDDLSGVTASEYVPDALKKEKKLNIIDRTRYNTAPRSRGGNPIEFIVIHYLGVPNADNPDLYGGGYGGHYYVSRAGQAYKAADPKKAVVWHCGGGLQGSGGHEFYQICTNFNSIGIECGVCYTENVRSADGDSNKWYFTTETQETLVKLVSQLMDEYNIPIEHVIRHFDVTGKTCLPVDSTELLTKDGWRTINELAIGETVAGYDPEKDRIIFEPIQGIVPFKEEEVLKNHHLEATADHRMYVRPDCSGSSKFRDVEWGQLLTGRKQYEVKTGALYDGEGLELSDDQIRLLVWIQGDGHYMKNQYGNIFGVEFHLSKKRKIFKIKSLLDDLDIPYKENWCKNGTVHIRITGIKYVEWAEQWLDNKKFTYRFLEMTEHQAKVFFEEIMIVDGCKSADVYTSTDRQNLDIVQALGALNGKRTAIVKMGNAGKNNLGFAISHYTVGNHPKVETTKRTTVVSCVTVPTGYILIRQNDRTFIVGNCPNPYVKNNKLRTSWTWDEFKQKLKAYRKGKDYLEKGDSGDAVKEMQTLLNRLGYGLKVDGDFGTKTETALKAFQTQFKMAVTGKYTDADKTLLEAKANARKASDITVKQFLDACQKVMDESKTYTCGTTHSIPPTADKKINGAGLIQKALYDLGFTDQAGVNLKNLGAYLKAHGFVRSRISSTIKPGSILLVKAKDSETYTHAFVVVDFDKWNTVRYDAGSQFRIQHKQPIKGLPWNYQKRDFTVYNIPE